MSSTSHHPTRLRRHLEEAFQKVVDKITIVSLYINECAGNYIDPTTSPPTTFEAEQAIEWLENFFKID